jgi:hypothetical protein
MPHASCSRRYLSLSSIESAMPMEAALESLMDPEPVPPKTRTKISLEATSLEAALESLMDPEPVPPKTRTKISLESMPSEATIKSTPWSNEEETTAELAIESRLEALPMETVTEMNRNSTCLSQGRRGE